jgi:hypothetical protein
MIPPLFEYVFDFIMKRCCPKKLEKSNKEWYYFKAHARLHHELDIIRIVKLRRLVDNSLKFLTTKRERRLVRMQADRNVI